jgi:hypothetical protein
MESLAFLVVVLLSILMLSGPIAIGLTSAWAQRYTEGKPALQAMRRFFAFGIATIGVFIAIQLMYETTPLAPKLMAIAAIAGSIYALRRERKYIRSK